jgi:hypothetical protein
MKDYFAALAMTGDYCVAALLAMTGDCHGLRPRNDSMSNDEKKPAEAGFLQCIRTVLT